MSEVAVSYVSGQVDEVALYLGWDGRLGQSSQGVCGQSVDVLLDRLVGPDALEQLAQCVDILVAEGSPNPFQERYWGVHGEHQRDPDTVTWIAVDRRQFENAAADGALLDGILAQPGWHVLLDQDDIVVAARDGPIA